MSFLAAEKKDHLARLGEGGGGELNGQCPFKIIFLVMDVVPMRPVFWPKALHHTRRHVSWGQRPRRHPITQKALRNQLPLKGNNILKIELLEPLGVSGDVHLVFGRQACFNS